VLSPGDQAGIAVGVIVFVDLTALALLLLLRHRRRRRNGPRAVTRQLSGGPDGGMTDAGAAAAAAHGLESYPHKPELPTTYNLTEMPTQMPSSELGHMSRHDGHSSPAPLHFTSPHPELGGGTPQLQPQP